MGRRGRRAAFWSLRARTGRSAGAVAAGEMVGDRLGDGADEDDREEMATEARLFLVLATDVPVVLTLRELAVAVGVWVAARGREGGVA